MPLILTKFKDTKTSEKELAEVNNKSKSNEVKGNTFTLNKPKRKKRVHKKSGRYRKGNFFSKKNNSTYVYRSAYEYAVFKKLEQDSTITSYVSEPFNIPYIDSNKKHRVYIPDIITVDTNNTLTILEIKPTRMLKNINVQLKAKSTLLFLKRNFPQVDIKYKFMTEEDIFTNKTEYRNIIKEIDGND